jgi:5-methylcytosine-specific restriction enzyme subunit McrC
MKHNKTLTIREYDFICSNDGHPNAIDHFDQLEDFVLKNDTYEYLKVTHKKGIGKVIQAQNYVGIIQTKDGTTIEILPKISSIDSGESGITEAKKILLKMLRTLKDSPFKNLGHANLKSTKMPLLELFISMFLAELTKLVQKGIKNEYISKEDNLSFLKGKLKMGEHVKRNFIHKEHFYVEFQEYLCDRVENRLIKTTLNYLYRHSKSSKNQQRIREFLFVFDEINYSNDPKSDFVKISMNRQMKDYEQILLWCKTFLLNNSFSPYKGNDVAFALLFDMNVLFESYVGHWLKRHFPDNDIKLQDKTHHLAYLEGRDGKFNLKPDIVINNGHIIADTKWKLLNDDKTHQGVAQNDMYQLFAYGKKYEHCHQMFLIYPKANINIYENFYHFHKNNTPELTLKILMFDLLNDICDIKV